jgi:nicotinamide-nucleotide amidase
VDDTLPLELIESARRVLDANRAIGRRLAVAESCTGGLVMAALTATAGSSDVVEVGFVTYSNEAKMKTLGVDINILDTFGAVSIATAWAMAQGALDRSSADVAVSITGRGASVEDVVADTQQFGDIGRGPIRVQAALVALELLMPRSDP